MSTDTTRDRAREVIAGATWGYTDPAALATADDILDALAAAGIQLAGEGEVAVQREALERAILQCINVARGIHGRGDRFRSDAILGAVHMIISMIDDPVEPWEHWRDRMYADPIPAPDAGDGREG